MNPNDLPQDTQIDLDTILQLQQKNDATKATNSMLSLTLQASLQEIAGYLKLIEEAKTNAKRDFYRKKIKKVTLRLRRILPQQRLS